MIVKTYMSKKVRTVKECATVEDVTKHSVPSTGKRCLVNQVHIMSCRTASLQQGIYLAYTRSLEYQNVFSLCLAFVLLPKFKLCTVMGKAKVIH